MQRMKPKIFRSAEIGKKVLLLPSEFHKSFIISFVNKKELKKRNFLIWTVLILILVITCLLVFDVLFLHPRNNDPQAEDNGLSDATQLAEAPVEKPQENSDLQDVTITLKNYIAYDLPESDFRFVIARLHVQAPGATNISLSHFTTSEGIRLDETQSYVEALEARSLYLGRQNVWFSLISQEKDYDANIFIPVTGNGASVSVSCDFGHNGDLNFSLIPASGTIAQLQYQAEDVITDGRTYQMTVSKAYDITGLPLYQKSGSQETEYLLPSTTKVYAFEVNAVSLYGDTVAVESASYVPNGSFEVFEALDASIRSMKYDNMIGVPITEHTTGYLLFYAYDPDTAPVTYQGVLKVKLAGVDAPVTVNVNLNDREGEHGS